jgi:transposase
MQEPETIQQMLALHTLGWGTKRIAKELEVARNTVKRYLAAGGYVPYQSPKRLSKLDGLDDWLKEQFLQHRGNCDVVRQELARVHGKLVSLRTVERACRPHRAELAARARATLRFETPPGKQMQIDFGVAIVEIGGEKTPVHLFVATLGYSRLGYVAAFTHERQSAWFAGMEGAFSHYSGIPREVLMDNAKPLVDSHNVQTREVVFNERLHAFARHWGFTPKACAPYRPRTKGKDENGVGYAKKNALAGRTFTSWAELEAHLAQWQREVADVRTHGSTGEAPRTRFEREERAALAPLNGRPPYTQARELHRVVNSEACVEVDTHRYSVPWRLIGESVTVRVEGEGLVVSHAGREVARHEVLQGTRDRSIDPAHFDGLVGRAFTPRDQPANPVPAAPEMRAPLDGELARPLAEYEAITGGAF